MTLPEATETPETPETGTQEGVRLFVQPDAGSQVITDAIDHARKSVWMKIYLLTSTTVIESLEKAADRGVDVRVMLENRPFGGGNVSPQETMARLRAAGIKAKEDNPKFALTHEKSMVIDGKTAFIMNSNMTKSALNESKNQRNREFGIITTNPQDVNGVVEIFQADWERREPRYYAPNLVVSPINARSTFLTLINGAEKTLYLEQELVNDDQIELALVGARKRGVDVKVISSEVVKDEDSTSREGVIKMGRARVPVRILTKLYMHAKLILVDGQKAYIGSVNISTYSLDRNRELGIVISDQKILETLQQTFAIDWKQAKNA
jgi:phosphatidylserine/phosphatidylglycerophosphate/cardiolipin synthase-like enzyme